MWSQIVLCLCVGLALATTNPAWKDNTEYVYYVNGRTLSSLHEAHDQYSGIFLKAKLHISPRSDGKLQGRISDPQYAQIQSHLPDGWRSEVPENHLSYKQLPLSQKPFQLEMENGLVDKLIVEKELNSWEANIIKSIVSQFQLDLQGQNAIESSYNNFPSSDSLDGTFKTMEETVTGETETLYDIHPFPEYLLQSQPWLAPQEKLRGDGQVFEVIKTKNYTNAEERPSYHYGFGQIEEDEPSSNQVGQFFIREGYSRAIVTGKPSRYVIQNSYTVNKIMVNPIFKSQDMGSVISMVNVTLFQVNTQGQQPQDLSNPIEIGDLVYTYGKPFSKSSQVQEKLQGSPMEDDSSEEQDSSEDNWKRFRRSAGQMIRKQSHGGYSQDSQEDSQQQQPRPQMSHAPESPLLPYMMGYHGKSIKESKDFDIKQNVAKLVQEMSQEIEDPEKILSESTLNKYTILNSLVRLMDEQEIKSVAEQLYSQNQQGQQSLAWAIYRDSVAEAGTGPAFLNIREWIESKKIQKYEAAEVIAAMTNAVRVPTEEYMRKYFELIKEPQVKQQEYLNETAVLAYTDLVHQVYINKNESHNQYPVHSFGSFYTKEGRQFVKSTVIPYLYQQLNNAISSGDARKTHVYIRALGNIGHKKILEAFEPYLEGDKQASQFQRFLMVVALDRLAYNNPTVARSVLYKIYQNAGEIPEVRVVAVSHLIKTNPPVEMLQHMAENTHTDNQEQVNAAVKSVIESATQLRSHRNRELQRAAQSAKPLLTRDQYGFDQSYLHLRDYITEQMDVEASHKFVEISSSDSNWPNSLGVEVRGEWSGMRQQYLSVDAMISSISELTNVLYDQTEQSQKAQSQRKQQQGSDGQWSSANIAKLMSYERDEREQLEAVIFAEMEHFQKLWSFDNQTLEQLPEDVRQQEETYKNGKKINYSKLKQLKEMALSFPTEMGLPFLYTYDVPMLSNYQGEIRAIATPQISRNNKLHTPDKITAEIRGHATISGKVQSHLSFVTPFDHQVYLAGYDRSMQAHLPVNAKVEFDIKNQEYEIEIEVGKHQDGARLLHFNSDPYTSRSDIMNIRPVALRPNTYVIPPKQNHRYFDTVIGKKQTGLAFRVWGHHPEQSISLGELARIWQSEGAMQLWDQLWDKVSLQNTEASIAYVPSQSTAQKFTVRYSYEQQYRKQPESQNKEDFLSLSQLNSKLQSDSPSQRQQEIIKHVGSGIRSAHLGGHDVSLEIEGDKKYNYVLGYAYAKSNADPRSKTVIYYQNKDQGRQGAIQIEGKVPNTNALDLTNSLETEPTSKYEVKVQMGKSDDSAAKISAQIDMSRSDDRKEYLINEEPLYRVCKEQMQQGNFQLPACRNMTIRANFLDDIKFKAHYQNLDDHCAETIEAIYQGLRVYYYPMTETNTIQSQGDNTVTGRIRFQPEGFRKFNVTVRHQDEEVKMYNLSMENEFVKAVLVPHPVFHLPSRVGGVLSGWQNFRRTCVIDKTAAKTFSNKTYPLSLDKQYTVVMQYIPEDARSSGDEQESVEQQLRQQTENYVVLARQSSGEQREVIVTFNHEETDGKTVQIELKPQQGQQQSGSNPAASVTVDGQQVKFDDKEIADLYDGFVQIYALPNGEVKLEIEDAFYLIYDGQRVMLTDTSSTLRDATYGLCGQNSDDEYEDFTVPANCVVRDSQKFVESYQVEGGQQRRPQRSQEYQQGCVEKVLPLYSDVISDRDAGRSEGQHRQHSSSGGTKLRTRYVEENGEICFTTRPVPVCNSQPRETTTKNVGVHCIQGSKTAYYLKSQIDQGGNPNFSGKPETKKVPMEVPSQCN